jgi:cation transport ATPase
MKDFLAYNVDYVGYETQTKLTIIIEMVTKSCEPARSGKKIIAAGFILSILYNIVGISYAAQGSLSPMIAAILMPASTISIIILTAMGTRWAAKK